MRASLIATAIAVVLATGSLDATAATHHYRRAVEIGRASCRDRV